MALTRLSLKQHQKRDKYGRAFDGGSEKNSLALVLFLRKNKTPKTNQNKQCMCLKLVA